MELRERQLCTLEGVVFSSWAIQASPLPSSTQRRILAACGFSATLLFPKAPFSSCQSSLLGHMYHFLLPDARYVPWSPVAALGPMHRPGQDPEDHQGVRCCGPRGGRRRRARRGQRPPTWAARKRRRRTAAADRPKRPGTVLEGGSSPNCSATWRAKLRRLRG